MSQAGVWKEVETRTFTSILSNSAFCKEVKEEMKGKKRVLCQEEKGRLIGGNHLPASSTSWVCHWVSAGNRDQSQSQELKPREKSNNNSKNIVNKTQKQLVSPFRWRHHAEMENFFGNPRGRPQPAEMEKKGDFC